jgi:hypothetical protein
VITVEPIANPRGRRFSPGQTDMVAMGGPLLASPISKKAFEGRRGDSTLYRLP